MPENTNPTPAATAPTPQAPSVLSEIEAGLQAAQTELPSIIGFLATFIPQLRAVQPFLSLLPVAIEAVQTISAATGQSTPTATQAVAAHLTPGQPNSPSLSVQGGGS